MAICFLLSLQAQASDSDLTAVHNKGKTENAEISGEYVFYISAAFDDYVKSHQNQLQSFHADLRYFIFTIRDDGNFIVVGISYDQARLVNEKKILMVGGGAEYMMKKGSNKIENKIFFK